MDAGSDCVRCSLVRGPSTLIDVQPPPLARDRERFRDLVDRGQWQAFHVLAMQHVQLQGVIHHDVVASRDRAVGFLPGLVERIREAVVIQNSNRRQSRRGVNQ